MNALFHNQALILAGVTLVLPLVGMLVLLMVRVTVRRTYPAIQTFFLAISFITAVLLFLDQGLDPEAISHGQITWLQIGGLVFNAGFLVTGTAVIMTLVVTLVATLVSLYSHVYMKHETGLLRYFAMLGFFTFSMLGIVFADNLIMIFVYWELVGFSSYTLINHFYTLPEANAASKKAFLVNRVGDAGFLMGIALLWAVCGTADLLELQRMISASELSAGMWNIGTMSVPAAVLTIAGLGLFAGAIGKSAQFPLQVWLPDAMAGPTPVSALIHAATMVAAGVFLLARIFPILGWDALQVIAVTGAITAFMGAVAAMTQHDIKRVLAFSTISQLGYMVMGLGTGAYDAALFHLFTHAFFKAGLFLAAGSVIYALHQFGDEKNVHFDAQDMRNMGGLRKFMPVTFVAYTVLTMSLAGLPLFSGFLSKDAIILGAFAWAGNGLSWRTIVPILGLVTVALTAFYMMRQLILVFFGTFRAKEGAVVHESPRLMRYILIFLAAMSFAFVWSLNPLDPEGSWIVEALSPPLLVAPDITDSLQSELARLSSEWHIMVSISSFVMIAAGAFIALRKFHPNGSYVLGYGTMGLPEGPAGKLSYRNWFLDDIYSAIIVKPVLFMSSSLRKLDAGIIDGFINGIGMSYVVASNVLSWIDQHIVDGLVRLAGSLVRFGGRIVNGLAKGNVQYFILMAVLGAIVIIWLVN